MTDTQLQEFIPKLGDRIAFRQFLKLRTHLQEPTTQKKQTLLDNLRKKLQNKNCIGTEEEIAKQPKRPPHYCAEKQISLAWVCRRKGESKFKQVRKGGGGTRKIKVPKLANRDYIIKKAIELFFPNGKSKAGLIDYFDTDLLFEDNKLDEQTTIADLLEKTALTNLRFCLTTDQKRRDDDYEFVENRLSSVSLKSLS